MKTTTIKINKKDFLHAEKVADQLWFTDKYFLLNTTYCRGLKFPAEVQARLDMGAEFQRINGAFGEMARKEMIANLLKHENAPRSPIGLEPIETTNVMYESYTSLYRCLSIGNGRNIWIDNAYKWAVDTFSAFYMPGKELILLYFREEFAGFLCPISKTESLDADILKRFTPSPIAELISA